MAGASAGAVVRRVLFFDSGWAKLHNLDQFAKNFAGWGIPYPAFNAALSAYNECIGGMLTMAGLE